MTGPREEIPAGSSLGLGRRSSRIAAAVLAAFLVGAALRVDEAGAWIDAAKRAVVGGFDWLFVGLATAVLVAVIAIGLHPAARRLRLGPDDEPPEFRRLSWFAMLFSAGLASGLLYWAAAEPILHFADNPFLGAGREDATRTALRITIFHWGVHGWAFYVATALAIGLYSHRHGRPLTLRTALAPVLGDHLDRWPGLGIDTIALFGTVCGVATSIGLAAGSMNATLSELTGLTVGLPQQIGIVLFVCAFGVVSAVSGVSRGIRWLSEWNVWISGLLLVTIALLGPTAFLGGLFLQTAADYAWTLVPTGAWLASSPEDQAWQADWTVFYWGWWLAWTPFVSLFVARISKGRTVREFVLAVLVVPTLVIVVWMTVFGGTALHQEVAQAGAVSEAVARDTSLGLVTMIGNLGAPALQPAIVGVAAFLLFTWLVTSLDSATLVICHLLGAEEAPPAKMFWGAALAAVTCVLLAVGGVGALQAASIVVGLPLAVVVGGVTAGLLNDLFRGRL